MIEDHYIGHLAVLSEFSNCNIEMHTKGIHCTAILRAKKNILANEPITYSRPQMLGTYASGDFTIKYNSQGKRSIFTNKDISEGDFVSALGGEMISFHEALVDRSELESMINTRIYASPSHENTYYINTRDILDDFQQNDHFRPRFADNATLGLGSFINTCTDDHSGSNVEMKTDSTVPYFVATRNIANGEELLKSNALKRWSATRCSINPSGNDVRIFNDEHTFDLEIGTIVKVGREFGIVRPHCIELLKDIFVTKKVIFYHKLILDSANAVEHTPDETQWKWSRIWLHSCTHKQWDDFLNTTVIPEPKQRRYDHAKGPPKCLQTVFVTMAPQTIMSIYRIPAVFTSISKVSGHLSEKGTFSYIPRQKGDIFWTCEGEVNEYINPTPNTNPMAKYPITYRTDEGHIEQDEQQKNFPIVYDSNINQTNIRVTRHNKSIGLNQYNTYQIKCTRIPYTHIRRFREISDKDFEIDYGEASDETKIMEYIAKFTPLQHEQNEIRQMLQMKGTLPQLIFIKDILPLDELTMPQSTAPFAHYNFKTIHFKSELSGPAIYDSSTSTLFINDHSFLTIKTTMKDTVALQPFQILKSNPVAFQNDELIDGTWDSMEGHEYIKVSNGTSYIIFENDAGKYDRANSDMLVDLSTFHKYQKYYVTRINE